MQGVMFDLDGTTLDTLDDIGHACNIALSGRGYPPHPLPAYKQMVGNGFIVLVQRALSSAVVQKLTPDEFESIVDDARIQYAQNMYERTKPYQGLPEVLQQLAESGIILSVLSNKPEELTQALIQHYYPQIPFSLVFGGRSDRPLKPDPTTAQAMLQTMQLDPAECLYVGDSDVDMQTARAAGMLPIGVSWGFRGAKELLQAGAHCVIDEPKQLLALCRR